LCTIKASDYDALRAASKAPEKWPLRFRTGANIRWNAYGVPYIASSDDRDAALALGAAVYSLRGSQIQLFRKAALGKLAECAGPGFLKYDHLIRLLDFTRTSAAVWNAMPEFSRLWLEGFCEGLNAVASITQRSIEDRLLNLHHHAFTVHELLAMGRLTGTDVNWPILFSLLPLRNEPYFDEVWQRLIQSGSHPKKKLQGNAAALVSEQLLMLSRSGSNCIAVAGQHCSKGYPMLAGDPHLGQQLPNVWLAVGISCPSLKVVGLMFPAIPVVGLGRNADVAWGGTNLRAASSDLVRLTPEQYRQSKPTRVRFKSRFWRTTERTLRWSVHGPVVSDAAGVLTKNTEEHLALRWAGHWPSDEITAFLNLMRARTACEIQNAMQPYGVTGLNILAADRHGNIAHTLAAWLPVRSGFEKDDCVVSNERAQQEWSKTLNSTDLAFNLNPQAGVLISTNDPTEGEAHVGFFFNGQERKMRLQNLFEQKKPINIEKLGEMQCDVVSPSAFRLCRQLLKTCNKHSWAEQHSTALKLLETWNGSYEENSAAALLFEVLIQNIAERLFKLDVRFSAWEHIQEWAYINTFLQTDLDTLKDTEKSLLLSTSLAAAEKKLRRYKSWGRVHRLHLKHPLAGVPVLGKKLFSIPSWGASGSRETLMKNAHAWIKKPKPSLYGAQARHISDLSDEDANHFVLLGGQSEHLKTRHGADQIELWRSGSFMQLPLSEKKITELFPDCWTFVAPNSHRG
jgi:penicillin amidase